MMEREYEFVLKLLLLGDSSVGKTCILLKFTNDSFDSTFITTIGVDFKVRTIEVEGTKIKLQVWDSAGQERFRSIISAFFRGATGIMLVYDITNEKSFDNISKWIKSIDENAAPDVERMIIGNKCDLEEQRVISMERGRLLAEEYDVKFIETSAKTGYNIEDAFFTLSKVIKQKMESKPVKDRLTATSGIRVSKKGGHDDNMPKKAGKCC